MKKLIGILIVITLLLHENVVAQQAEQQVGSWINSGQFFQLNQAFPQLQNELTPFTRDLAEGCIDMAFNKPRLAIPKLQYVIDTYPEVLGDNIVNIATLLSEQLYAQGEYTKAAAVMEHLLQLQGMPQDIKTFLGSFYRKYNAVRNLPKSTVTRPHATVTVPFATSTPEDRHHIHIPVELAGTTVPFIFDTGAAVNMVSRSFAKAHGIRIVADSIFLTGVAGGAYAQLGVADLLKIGSIEYSNVVFYVADDKDIIPDALRDKFTYSIDAIIGMEFLLKVGITQVSFKDKCYRFPVEAPQLNTTSPNAFIWGGGSYLQAYMPDNDAVILKYDTGASKEAYFTQAYYQKHLAYFRSITKQVEQINIGGFGGVAKNVSVLDVSALPLRIGNVTKDINVVVVDPMPTGAITNDGGLGLDFFRLFDNVTLNYNDMQVVFE